MLKKILPFLLVLAVFVGCSKGTLESRPSIELRNMNSTQFPIDPNTFFIPDLVMTIRFDDKEGDLAGGTVTYIRVRTNLDPIENPAANDKIDTIRSLLPDFQKATTGEIDIKFPGNFLIEDPRDNDSMYFRITVQDVAGNASDTIDTPPIVQIKN